MRLAVLMFIGANIPDLGHETAKASADLPGPPTVPGDADILDVRECDERMSSQVEQEGRRLPGPELIGCKIRLVFAESLPIHEVGENTLVGNASFIDSLVLPGRRRERHASRIEKRSFEVRKRCTEPRIVVFPDAGNDFTHLLQLKINQMLFVGR